jgi:hypothetical protein
MTEPHRRLLCRVLFIMMGLVPTAVVTTWAAWTHVTRAEETARGYWQSRLLQELGLAARMSDIREGPRGDVVFDELSLRDPETDALIAAVRRAHLAPTGERGWLLDTAYVEVPSDQLLRLWTPVYDRLRRSRGTSDWSGLVMAQHVTLQRPALTQSLSQVECQFGESRSGAFAQIEFLVAGLNMSERGRLVITRERKQDRPQTVLVLQTGPRPLPCSLASASLPALERLGPSCHFAGSARFRLTDQGWQGESLQGQLSSLDLARLLSDLFPQHLLHGQATVDIREATFADGRLTAAEGTLRASEGVVNRHLLESAGKWLEWRIAESVTSSPESRLRFAELHVDFRIDSSGLTLHGRCGEPGVILLAIDGPLAWEAGKSVPVTNLVRTLVPDSIHQVPATRQTAWLAQILPVPRLEPGSTSSNRVDAPPLRMKGEE